MAACCKVGSLISSYDLQHGVEEMSLEEYLLARWLGEGEYAATGLRPLKDWFNRKLMTTVYNEHGRNALDTRVQSDYETLTGEARRLALLDDLAADGIDGEQLCDDFISTATLYRHFTTCLDVSKSDEGGAEESNWEAEKIAYARDIVRTNVEESLRSLENKGTVPGGTEAVIKTEVVLGCPDCATQVGVERAIERGYVCREHMGPES